MQAHYTHMWILKIAALIILILSAGLYVFLSLSSQVTNNLDTYVYELPFKEGEGFKVVQGYGGLFSHKHKAALDFNMPEGAPIYAARGGSIYSFKDNSDEGGPFTKDQKKANYLIIQHSDGSFGCYWHLQKNGVVVKKGTVETGQLIGYSGKTGFVLQAHLHFAVKRRLNYEKDSFVRTKFRTTGGVQLLQRGKKYVRPSN